MSIKVTIGMFPSTPLQNFELRILADRCTDAVQKLGYFRQEATAWLTEAMADCINHDWRKLLAQGELLTDRDKWDFDIVGTPRLGWETWVALTPAGKADPKRAVEVSYRRIVTGFYLRRRSAEIMEHDDFLASRWQYEITVLEKPCRAVARKVGKHFIAGKHPVLPLDNCQRQYCVCTYRQVKVER